MKTEAADTRSEEIAARIRGLAPTVMENARRADEAREIPLASFAALRERGVLNVLVSEALGGFGADVFAGADTMLFVEAVAELGRLDMSTAHCFQVHNHTANLLETLCPADQAARYLGEARADGSGLLSWAGSEPGLIGRGMAYETLAEPVDGGYRVNGLKSYATNATVADWILIHAKRADLPGEGDSTSMQMMMVPREAAGVTVDASGWQPMGMRGCVSPMVRLADVFVPDRDLVGEPGTYGREGLGGDVHLGFSANYLGVSRGMLEYARERAMSRGIGKDPHTQRMLGECRTMIESARALVSEAALADVERLDARRTAAIIAKNQSMATAEEVARRAMRISGSSALFAGEPLERAVRDLNVQALHTHADTSAQMLGLEVLEVDFDRANQQIVVPPNRPAP